DARFLDPGVRIEHGFDLGGPHLEARAIDHALQAVGNEEVALVVVVAEVAGAEKALAVVLDERLARRLVLLPVTLEYLRAVHHDLADLAGAQFRETVWIQNARIGVEDRDAAALALGAMRRVDVSRRHGFGEPVS